MLRYNPKLKQEAQSLRSSMTDAEQLLWFRLRRKQLAGVRFYRQRPIGDYIVDFYAPVVGLVIEVDGSQHLEQAQEEYDQRRSVFLTRQGLQVLRFNNLEVLKELDRVVEVIFRIVVSIRDKECF